MDIASVGIKVMTEVSWISMSSTGHKLTPISRVICYFSPPLLIQINDARNLS